MKKFLLISLCLFCTLAITTSCSNDDTVDTPSFVKGELFQTTWKGQQIIYDEQGNATSVDDFYVEFQEEPTAYYIETGKEEDQRRYFKYKIEGKMLYASSEIYGHWTLIKKTKNEMILQAFLPEKSVMTLNRVN